MDGHLQRALRSHLADIDDQIVAVVDSAMENEINAYQMRNPDGSFVLTPLLLAKAQTLNALAVLKSTK